MIEIKKVQQKTDGHNWMCGAACLEMIFDHYNMRIDQNVIWTSIRVPRGIGIEQYYAKTHGLARYAIEQGLNATIYIDNENTFDSLLDMLEKKKVPIIMSVMEPKSGGSHFVVYVGKENCRYYFADPNSDLEKTSYDYDELKDIWSPRRRIDVTGFVYIIFEGESKSIRCPVCKNEFPIILTDNKLPSNIVVCPYCDIGFAGGKLTEEFGSPV